MHSLLPVYPRIKHVGFLEAHVPVAYPFAVDADLLVTFAVDTPVQFVTLTREGMVERR